MQHKIIKSAALIMAILFGLSTAGCADTSWALKIDGDKIPSGVYVTYLLTYGSEVLSGTAGSSSSSSGSSSSSSSPLDVTAPSDSSSTSSDPWTGMIDGTNADAWASQQAVNACKQLAVIENLCKQRKITLTSDESSTVNSAAESDLSQYALYKSNGVSQASLQRILSANYYLNSKLFDSYYAKGGEQEVATSDIKDYYAKNFVHIKQIFFSKYDSSNNLLSAADQAKKKASAEAVLKKVLADKSKFDSLVKTYNEDPGMTQDPEGYTFDKSADYLQTFIDTAYSIKIGDVKLIESDEGWHIMYKQPLDLSSKTFDSSMQETALESMKSNDFMNLINAKIKDVTVTENSKAITRYDPQKLKYS